jgi:hypothetical protein
MKQKHVNSMLQIILFHRSQKSEKDTTVTFTSQWHILQSFYEFLFVSLLRMMSTVPESGLRSDPSLVLVLVWPLFQPSHPCGVLYSLRTSPPMSHCPTLYSVTFPLTEIYIYPQLASTLGGYTWRRRTHRIMIHGVLVNIHSTSSVANPTSWVTYCSQVFGLLTALKCLGWWL